MPEMTPAQSLEAAKVYVDNYLHDLCEELIAWDEHKVRPDGKLHELLALCRYARSSFHLAKQLVADAAIRQVAKARWDY